MSSRDEDEAWRQIVANYGEQPSVDDLPRVDDPPVGRVPDDLDRAPDADPAPGPAPDDGSAFGVLPWEEEGRYVPPPPPPIPRPEPRRALAWVGLFGAPIVLLVALVFGIYLPGWVSAILVGGFIGGFVYLVSTMSKDPRDPGDDGAVV